MSGLSRRQLIAYAWPLAAASLAFIVTGLTDTTVVAYYSTPALAGLTLATSIYQLFSISMLSGLTAYNILLPRTTGKDGKQRRIHGLFIVLRWLLPISCLVGLLLATIAALVLVFVTDLIWAEAARYLLVMSLNLPIALFCSSLLTTAVVWGKTKYPLAVLLVYAIINLIMDLLLVYGLGPFPRLGVLGSAIASVVSALIVAPWAVLRVRKLYLEGYPLSANRDSDTPAILESISLHKSMHKKGRVATPETQTLVLESDIPLKIPSKPVSNKQADRELFAGWGLVSLQSVMSMVLDYFAALLFTLIVSTAGAELLGSSRFGLYAETLSFMLIGSLCEAGVILLGRAFGNTPLKALGEHHSIRRTFIIYSVIIGIVIAVLSKPASLIVSPDAVIQDNSFFIVLIVSASCPLIGWCFANITLLRTNARTGMDFAGNVIAVWAAQIPVAIIGLYFMSVRGAFFGVLAYWLLRAALTHIFVKRLSKNSAKNSE
ncbi:MATE family efflux transporter [Tropheryma whipplei]|uniref:MATE family efflux transporter n=1 Tax=Tropheryma whipplei TaxID=2039 RepID=UPI0005A9F5D5|nr:MATE family efflux transporter [Tropheryma whipplei]